MGLFREGPVRVRVPATSANLGPGFDCFGLALELADEVEAAVLPTGVEVGVAGEGAQDVPRGEDHLVVRSMRLAFEEMGVPQPGLRLSCRNRIPHSRGMGSSSAAIVAGIWLARALLEDPTARLDEEAALALASRIEGHPDNVAAALLGGFVVAGQDGESVWALRSPVHPSVSAVVFVPRDGVRTEVARGLLPDAVAHRDAAADAGRAALLVAALAGAPEMLLRGTEDFLHQEQRGPAMPDSLALVHRLRAAGVPAVISGAGPSVLAFVTRGSDQAAVVLESGPSGWRTLPQAVGGEGATVLG